MTSLDVVFRDRYGLHPRAALRIQQEAARFRAAVTIQGLDSGGSPVGASSMISMVSAGIRNGEAVRIVADGDEAADAAAAVGRLMESGVCHP
jgi:phosphotransferase system HPr (HPr) family protein